jgi:hypothetical protein
MFHGDRCVFEVLYLPLVRVSAFKSGVEDNKDQDGSHNDYVDKDNKSLFHALISHKSQALIVCALPSQSRGRHNRFL